MTSIHTRNPQFGGRLSALALVAAIAVAALTMLWPASAAAEYGIQPGSAFVKGHNPVSPKIYDFSEFETAPPGSLIGFFLPGGTIGALLNPDPYVEGLKNAPEVTQAGGHPDFTTNFQIQDASQQPAGETKDIFTDLPPGSVGFPEAVARCESADLQLTLLGNCPTESQVGIALTRTGSLEIISPVASMVPQPHEQASLGYKVIGYTINLFARARSESDYGLTVEARDLPTAVAVKGTALTLWGVPYDHIHDNHRFDTDGSHGGKPLGASISGSAIRPFTSAPTNCDTGPLTATVKVRSWGHPDEWKPADSSLSEQTGCEQVEFNPDVSAQPTTGVADSPTGLNLDVHVPQNTECDPGPPIECKLSTSHLKDTKIVLPKGMALNPSAANGLTGCPPAGIGLTTPVGSLPIQFTGQPANCPDGSKLGTAEIETPLLEAPAPGAVYLAKPFDNPFKSRFAIYIEVNDPTRGLVSKFAGHIVLDPDTGQLTTTVVDQPQLPLEHIRLNLKQGPHAALRTPQTCDKFTTVSTLTPYSAPESPVTFEDDFSIDSGPDGNCDLQNGPSIDAGTIAPIAGQFSPLLVHLSRPDGSQEFSSVKLSLPPGLTARLAGIPYCPDSALSAAANKSGEEEQASPSCPAASKVGDVDVGAGAGPSPYFTHGQAYLSGPYKGAPLSVAVVVPVNAGPFDLGTVVVRVALQVNPLTAQITATSDEIPHILDGIPLDVRSVAIQLDRNEFTKNPTSCDPMSVDGSLASTLGSTAALTERFQLGECRRLGFKPKLSLRLSGKSFKRTADPKLTSVLTTRPGDANLASASVQMPSSIILDQDHIANVCTRVQFAADECPSGSIYGHAIATTPLLDKPLEGNVYLRSSDNPVPDLVADLQGQVPVEVVGRTDTVKGALRTNFDVAPDAPIDKFVLSLEGGKKSLLLVTKNLCGGKQVAKVKLAGHNGRQSVVHQRLEIPCGKKKRRSARHASR
jgi:hypothetical protein